MNEANALIGLAVFSVLILFWIGPWQTMCIDVARQYLFAKRDRLFDLAHEGKLDFSSDVYMSSRLGVERLIRFVHFMSLGEFLTHIANRPSVSEVKSNDLRTLVAEINDISVRKEVLSIVDNCTLAAIVMMLVRNPFGAIIIVVIYFLVRIGVSIDVVKQSPMVRFFTYRVESESSLAQ